MAAAIALSRNAVPHNIDRRGFGFDASAASLPVSLSRFSLFRSACKLLGVLVAQLPFLLQALLTIRSNSAGASR